MKKLLILTPVFLFCFLAVSCQKSSNQTWENMKTAGAYLNKGITTLCGNYSDSRLLESADEFTGPGDGEFIPLNDKDLKAQFINDRGIPQPRFSPGDKGSPIPGLGEFKTPTGELAAIFKRVHFGTDDHMIKLSEDVDVIRSIAAYMKKNSRVYLSIEGHCDERASAAYNMALGARRANHVRVLLIKNGVDFNRIYTISHGKEKPLALGHGEEDWRANRRAEFKIFVK